MNGDVVADTLLLDVDEVRALVKFLDHQHISYEDVELLEVVRKLGRFLSAYDER